MMILATLTPRCSLCRLHVLLCLPIPPTSLQTRRPGSSTLSVHNSYMVHHARDALRNSETPAPKSRGDTSAYPIPKTRFGGSRCRNFGTVETTAFAINRGGGRGSFEREDVFLSKSLCYCSLVLLSGKEIMCEPEMAVRGSDPV